MKSKSAEPPSSVRVVIADNDSAARRYLRCVIECIPTALVVAEARSGIEALALLRQIRPDLVTLDLSLPEMDGLAVARLIQRECLGARVIFVTRCEDPAMLLEALRAGAAGFVLKDASAEEITSAIRAALQGEIFVTARFASCALRKLVASNY